MIDTNKLQQMYSHLGSLGIAKSTIAPPAYRVAWRFGMDVTPPLFASFAANALFTGALFGVLWGLAMWAFFWLRFQRAIPSGSIVVAAIVAGVLFGLCMAAYFRHVARKNNLPGWAQYGGRAGA